MQPVIGTTLVAAYGYYAVFGGTVLEGETVLLAAGFAARRGLLDWPLVVLVATAGGALGDQLAFLLGRWRGLTLIERFPSLARHKSKVDQLLHRYDAFCIVTVRFVYGLRIAGPIILGASPVSFRRFALFNLLGAAVWAVLISGTGYAFGVAIGVVAGEVRHVEEAVIVGILVVGSGLWLWRKLSERIQRRREIVGRSK